MIIPVNFVVGAAVGAVSTYIYKDEACKKWLRDAGTKLKNRAYSVTTSPVKHEEEVTESTTQVRETAEEMTEKDVSTTANTKKTDTSKPKQRAKPV